MKKYAKFGVVVDEKKNLLVHVSIFHAVQ